MDIGSSPEVVSLVLSTWVRMLNAVETMNDEAPRLIDWVAKKRLVDGFRDRHGLKDGDPRLKAIDLQYHDLRPNMCLAFRCGLETLVPASEVALAVDAPPEDTRAYMRGMLMRGYSEEIVSANWDSIVVDIGGDVLKRIDMPDPLRGTRTLTERLFEGGPSLLTLLKRLEGR
jgi:proteasome accessory factor A